MTLIDGSGGAESYIHTGYAYDGRLIISAYQADVFNPKHYNNAHVTLVPEEAKKLANILLNYCNKKEN